jgi:hypothetical protein
VDEETVIACVAKNSMSLPSQLLDQFNLLIEFTLQQWIERQSAADILLGLQIFTLLHQH